MDLGVVGCFSGSGVVCSDNTSSVFASTVTATSDAASAETKQKLYGSGGVFKQVRSFEDKDLRDTKVAKTSYSSSNPISEKQQMLSFSSPNCSESVTMPYYHHIQDSNGFTRNSSGYGNWGLYGGSMDGVLTGIRGSFTASQWMELEHQALIYKYITANVPIPTYLLNPIKKALESAGFSSFLGLRSNALEWGAFQIGFSNTSDPEPGRCRRTDGKKWRCSRDAVADHKYCERHMNRGRHRSRKPVEGQTGHSVSETTTTAAAKLMTFSSSTSAALVPGGAASNSLALSHHHQLNNLQPAATNPSSRSPYLERSLMGKENDGERYTDTKGLSIVSPSVKGSHSSNSKERNPCDEAFRAGFGLVCPDPSVKPLNKSTSLVNNQSYGNSHDISDRKRKLQHPLRRFMDDWPQNQSDQSTMSWPDIETNKFNLSIAIPRVTSDFMSSTSSPTNEKLADSPPALSRELEATRMGLGMGTNMISDQNQRQGNWNTISWESSMGGPLGEALQSTNSSSGDCNDSSALNLMTEAWNRSPRMESSPTGVLQKVSFVSVSNSSAGSSPRTHESSNLCNVLFGTTLMNPTL